MMVVTRHGMTERSDKDAGVCVNAAQLVGAQRWKPVHAGHASVMLQHQAVPVLPLMGGRYLACTLKFRRGLTGYRSAQLIPPYLRKRGVLWGKIFGPSGLGECENGRNRPKWGNRVRDQNLGFAVWGNRPAAQVSSRLALQSLRLSSCQCSLPDILLLLPPACHQRCRSPRAA